MMDTTMAWLSQGNLHCLAALEAPSHSLELMGWELPRQEESSGSGRKVCGGASHPDPGKRDLIYPISHHNEIKTSPGSVQKV